ncbi:MAG: hypothetical protein MO847_11905 [Candidatus Protistobacter heckmanni]|nr:hypothetical protein [Candidatus Protistobacter heckmanni]
MSGVAQIADRPGDETRAQPGGDEDGDQRQAEGDEQMQQLVHGARRAHETSGASRTSGAARATNADRRRRRRRMPVQRAVQRAEDQEGGDVGQRHGRGEHREQAHEQRIEARQPPAPGRLGAALSRLPRRPGAHIDTLLSKI